MEIVKYLTFFSAGRRFAIPFNDIRTVLVADKLEPIPEFPEYFAGSCRWNTLSVPVIDARVRLGFERADCTNRSCVIICETRITVRQKLGLIGILTDTVSEMTEIDPEKLQPVEAVNAEANNRYLQGVFIENGETCYVIDVGLMVNDTDVPTVRESAQELPETEE
ncbi:MAG: chemotaxis protein CheW [Ruminococcus sp.]|nr:chemotaxis protein CheW [Ruminococcus sp.]